MHPPSDLKRLQELFLRAITSEDPASATAAAGVLRGSCRLSALEGLAAYRSSVAGKLCRSLEAIFPVCRQLVGSSFFAAMAMDYGRGHPSTSVDLGDYGDGLPTFLESFEPARGLPYLSDVARLEWHWHRAFNAPDEPLLDLAALGRVEPVLWPVLRFALPLGSALLRSPYPIHRIWQAHQGGDGPEMEIDLSEGGVWLFIWRDGLETRLDQLPEEEWLLMQAFARGTSVGDLGAALGAAGSSVELASLLPLWVQRGWLRRFSLAPADPPEA